jgi:hypothetical protein
MILEGLVTTHNPDGTVNIAPQGPIVTEEFSRLRFRPFPTSVTYANLRRTRCGVFHVIDDVLLLARTALDLEYELPRLRPAVVVPGHVLVDCCRWYEFDVERMDEEGERPIFDARVVHGERVRDCWGFNRAKHAVIEATIAASRLPLLGKEAVQAELARLRSPVEKTGGPAEREAFRLVEEFVGRAD